LLPPPCRNPVKHLSPLQLHLIKLCCTDRSIALLFRLSSNVVYKMKHIGRVRKPKIDIFKITCKMLLCVGVGLIKKTLAWQKIPCIPCSGKIEKYLQIESFLAVAIRNLVCCNQSSFSGLVTIFPITLRHK